VRASTAQGRRAWSAPLALVLAACPSSNPARSERDARMAADAASGSDAATDARPQPPDATAPSVDASAAGDVDAATSADDAQSDAQATSPGDAQSDAQAASADDARSDAQAASADDARSDAQASSAADTGAVDAAAARDAAPEDARLSGAQRKCVVFLHGKSGAGFSTERMPAYWLVGPTGNTEGWGGKQWLYFPEARFVEVRQLIRKALQDNACTQAILHGFSNGAAAVAKLYCRGESFEGTVLGYVIDDPVPDHGADTCAPPPGAKARLYWTGALTAPDGWRCADGDWTCEGGTTVGIQKYAANLRLPATQSVNNRHEPYANPPEYRSWW
jgi:hypothetical protein